MKLTIFLKKTGLSKKTWNEERQGKSVEAIEHVRFVVKLYQILAEAGRWFLHEHPARASWWDLDEI